MRDKQLKKYGVIAALPILLIIGSYFWVNAKNKPAQITVVKAWEKINPGTNSQQYLVSGKLADGEAMTFKVEDTFLNFQFKSSDLYAKMEEGKTFDIEYVGFRAGFLSAYPNIISAEPVK